MGKFIAFFTVENRTRAWIERQPGSGGVIGVLEG